LIFKSENVASEINQIIQIIQEEYVPTFIKDNGEKEISIYFLSFYTYYTQIKT